MMKRWMLFSVVLISQALPLLGGWSVSVLNDISQIAASGILLQSANLGSGAQSQEISGIQFGTNYGFISGANPASSSWTAKFYSGTDAALNNLLNTGAMVREGANGGPSAIAYTISGLTVGNAYRFQLLVGNGGNGCNLYGNGWSDYSYIWIGDDQPRLAVYEWTADNATRIIRTNAGAGQGTHYNLACVLHDITPQSSDLNQDELVNGLDLAMISQEWLKEGLAGINSRSTDLNRSGRTEVRDISCFSANWLQSTMAGLLGLWKLDEGQGMIAGNAFGAYPATLYQTESEDWIATGDGYVVGLDARRETNALGEYIEVPRLIDNDFTLALWVRTTNTADNGSQWWQGKGLLDGELSGGTDDFGLSLLGNKAAFGVGGPAGDITIVSNRPVNDGQWHHLAATRNGTTGRMELYMDGLLSAEGVGPAGPKNQPTRLLVGSLNRASGKYLAGWFDDLRQLGRVLSAAEVAKLANKKYPAITAKKGFDLVASKWPGWQNALNQLKVSWFYGWGPGCPGVTDGIEWVPMQWGKWGDMNQIVSDLNLMKDRGIANYLLGFNEPDGADQANMTVDQALALWPRLLEPGLPIVSPACVHADNAWMKDFMARASTLGYRVDYIGVHWYGGTSADSLINHLQTVYNLYNRPLWITEFAPADWSASETQPNKISHAQVYSFLAEILWRLEKLDYVMRYAWFCSTSNPNTALGNSALFEADKATLTPCGRLYAAWDGDTDGPNPGQSYYLHHKNSHKQLSASGSAAVKMESITSTAPAINWKLVETGDGSYYLVNKDNEGKLRYVSGGSSVTLGSSGLTDDTVQWLLVPASNGWYYLDHKATGRRLYHKSGESTIKADATNPALTSDYVKWFFVKP